MRRAPHLIKIKLMESKVKVGDSWPAAKVRSAERVLK